MSHTHLDDALKTLKYYADRHGHDGNWNLALAAEVEVERRVSAARAAGYAEAKEQAATLAAVEFDNPDVSRAIHGMRPRKP